MAVVNPPGGKPAITDYAVIATDGATGTALVRCHLHTGRTHQIRVHLHDRGCALLGDPIYGKPVRLPELPERLMLHAWKLAFDHPLSGRRMAFEAPIPEEFDRWLRLPGAGERLRISDRL
jgi:23S rRNA pseudouridine1911/1915/1917 synthase